MRYFIFLLFYCSLFASTARIMTYNLLNFSDDASSHDSNKLDRCPSPLSMSEEEQEEEQEEAFVVKEKRVSKERGGNSKRKRDGISKENNSNYTGHAKSKGRAEAISHNELPPTCSSYSAVFKAVLVNLDLHFAPWR